MHAKILNTLLVLSSLIGYLEWSGNNHLFIVEAEREIILKLFTDPNSIIHPLIILPIVGQILLLLTLFQKKPNKIMTYISIAMLGCLLYLMLFIGIFSFNYKIIISTLPFLFISIAIVRQGDPSSS
ncbi:MAG: hypothetical protein KA210_11960 [Bacteroidia bacterium]|nr:hypothetical protein [Bacteroidia bacterium]